MIVIDTSVVIAFMNRWDDAHEWVAGWLETVDEQLFTTPLIAAEVDHLVTRVGGKQAARAFYDDPASGAYVVEWWPKTVPETVTLG